MGSTVTVRARHPLGSARLHRSSRRRAEVANAASVEGEASDKACEIADVPGSCKSVEAVWFPLVKRRQRGKGDGKEYDDTDALKLLKLFAHF